MPRRRAAALTQDASQVVPRAVSTPTSSSPAPGTPACPRRTPPASAAPACSCSRRPTRVVGRQLGVHRRGDPLRPRRTGGRPPASRRGAAAGHRPRAVHRGGLPRRHAPRDPGPRRPGDGAHPRRRLARRRPLARRPRRPLPAHVRAPELRGRGPPSLLGRPRRRDRRRRHRPHGGAPRRGRAPGIELRHEIAVEDLLRDPDGRVGRRRRPHAGRRADRDARARRRPRRRRLRVRPAHARGAPRAELGRREGPRDAEQHRRGARGRAAARRAGLRALERLPRDPVGRGRAGHRGPRDHEPLFAPVVSRRDRREPARRALPRRGRGLPQLHVREVRRRGPRQPEGVAAQVFDAKTIPLLRTIDYEAPGATRVDADTLEELADGLGIDPDGFARTVAEFNAAIVDGRSIPR